MHFKKNKRESGRRSKERLPPQTVKKDAGKYVPAEKAYSLSRHSLPIFIYCSGEICRRYSPLLRTRVCTGENISARARMDCSYSAVQPEMQS